MGFIEIDPKVFKVRLLGNIVEITITGVSCLDSQQWLNGFTIDDSELSDICCAICRCETQGEFEITSKNVYDIVSKSPLQYCGSWRIVPDYKLFNRLFKWWYNYNHDEALTVQTFQETFGKVLGLHYYEKWTGFDRSLSKMIGYFGEDTSKGQKFIDMVMSKVVQYENRTKPASGENDAI